MFANNNDDDDNDWFTTTDLACWDDQGRLYFCGRANDVIRTGGETVLATEVETVLRRHPWIEECAVVGLPDPRWGQAVSAVVVLKSKGTTAATDTNSVQDRQSGGAVIQLVDLRSFCANHGLAGYKRPQRLFQRDSLPRNQAGKLLKSRLQQELLPADVHSQKQLSTRTLHSKL